MMNVGTLKTLSYLTSFGLLGGIGYSLYDYYERGMREQYFDVGRAEPVLKGVEEPRPPTSRGLSYPDDITPAIVEFDWTGAPPPPPPKPEEKKPEGPVVKPVVPVDDILDVIAIMAASDNPSDSRCLIRLVDNKKAANSDYLLHIGDVLPSPHEDIAIFDIKPDDVTFSFADEERESETLRPHARSEQSMIAKAGKDGMVAPRRPSMVGGQAVQATDVAPVNTVKKNGQYYIGTDDAERFSQNYNDILARDIGSETYIDKDGNRAGIKITKVAKDSIAAQHGMQEGDIIKSINGYPVNSKQEAIAFAKKNSDRYEIWQIEVENLGRVRTEVYHSPKK
ncbi:PDZ domain (Also known as DHR or GLGF) [Planctomycetes bacterium Poly30]|uniref:PDZ domain (Also known as DHR or GLGF) n=1 Tax=Saltatorellus ferox TaxID=2528018 RepID=A0A518EWB1_9BACT|nr:PDZ domain (Also known as DHR or GLGF) [Planctomycetes bacterium Poly30]